MSSFDDMLKAALARKAGVKVETLPTPKPIAVAVSRIRGYGWEPLFFDIREPQVDPEYKAVVLKEWQPPVYCELAPEPSKESSPFAPVQADLPVIPKRETFSLNIVLNDRQRMVQEFAAAGKSFVVTGAAGTGKTTALREMARVLTLDPDLGYHTFKDQVGPAIAFCAYTVRASGNMARAIHKDPQLQAILQHNVLTIHKLLEYAPVWYEVQDENGDWVTKMRFEPKRTAQNPLTIKYLIVEESSMVSATELWPKLFDALLPGTRVILVGDINQLPPVMGKPILNYGLTTLPVIELKDVYRQALDSPIISNAHRVLKGQDIEPDGTYVKLTDLGIADGGKKLVSESKTATIFLKVMRQQFERGNYLPDEDIILTPYNKHDLGTVHLNKGIAQFLGDARNAMVYEIFAGMNKLYLAEGDRVMFNKRDGVITKIRHNALYIGKMPQMAGTDLTRYGTRTGKNGEHEDIDLDAEYSYENLNVDVIPEDEEQKEMKRAATHTVEITYDDGSQDVLSTAGDFNPQIFSLGYALTVWKAQGCEWRKVYFVLHKDQTQGLFRELVYTGITRAREYLVLIDTSKAFPKAIRSPRYPGNTLEEKIAAFNSKVALDVPIALVP